MCTVEEPKSQFCLDDPFTGLQEETILRRHKRDFSSQLHTILLKLSHLNICLRFSFSFCSSTSGGGSCWFKGALCRTTGRPLSVSSSGGRWSICRASVHRSSDALGLASRMWRTVFLQNRRRLETSRTQRDNTKNTGRCTHTTRQWWLRGIVFVRLYVCLFGLF